MKKYFEWNTGNIKNAKNEPEKGFFKLINEKKHGKFKKKNQY